jgi:membrane protein DedA with SNARE-associated domain
MEGIVTFLSCIDVRYIYLVVFLFAFGENLFPPLPSDVAIVFCGSLIGLGHASVLLTIVLATAGGTMGFMTMYWVGNQVGHKVLETGRIKFISVELVRKVEVWFRHYGYFIVVANRFLAGTRAVISFCAGASEMNLVYTTSLSTISSLVWNGLLIYFGLILGNNWREIGLYLVTYSRIVTIMVIAVILVGTIVAVLRARSKKDSGGSAP